MNYQNIYNQLIKKRRINKITRKDCYCQYHHIKPRSIYPDLIKDKNNIIALTAKEHYVAHHLLMLIYKKNYGQTHENYYKMLLAYSFINSLAFKKEKYITARMYQLIKIARSKIKMPEYVKQKMSNNHADFRNEKNPNYGKRMLFNIKTQQSYMCDKDSIQTYLNDGWVLKSEIKLFNNGIIQIYDVTKPEDFKPGHLKIQTQKEKEIQHENRSNAQKNKKYMYNNLTKQTIIAKSQQQINQLLSQGFIFKRVFKCKSIKNYIFIYNEQLNIKKRIKKQDFYKYQEQGYILLPKETWWNNGINEIKSVKQPSGYQKGRLIINVGRTLQNKQKKIISNGISKKRIYIKHKITGQIKSVQQRFLDFYFKNGFEYLSHKK